MAKVSAGDIPGYAEAVTREQQNREVAYLGVPFVAEGVRLAQMTPRILAALYAHRSPFVCGGSIPDPVESVVQFLWACSLNYSNSRFARWHFVRSIARRVRRGTFDIFRALDDIDEYVEVTFQDGPRGGPSSIPYVSQIAWIEYTMSGSPWNWTRERIMKTPLRIIYQQMRCKEMAHGEAPINPSDRIRAEWLDTLKARNIGNS